MRYQMKQKIWAMGDDFTIQDAEGRDVFLVDGKAFSFGDKLSFQDMAGNELAYIAQKVMSFKKRYEIYHGGQIFAEVVKEFSFFKDKYTVDIPGPNENPLPMSKKCGFEPLPAMRSPSVRWPSWI